MTDTEIELMLAELFFLDTEPDEADYVRTASRLTEYGWDRQKTSDHLIRFIAPVVAANVGFGIYPVIGEWAMFDPEEVATRVAKRKALRARHKDWMFFLQDKFYRNLLCRNKMMEFLNLLPA